MTSYADPMTQAYYDEPYAGAMRRGFLESSAALAKEPMPIPVQKVAGLDPYEMRAREMAGGLGGFTPYLEQGAQMAQQGYGTMQQGREALGGAQGMYGQGAGMVGRGADVLGQAQGMYGQGAGMVGRGADVLGQAQGMYGQGAGMVGQGAGLYGLGTQMTGQAAQMFDPFAAKQFYNPYEQDVVQQTLQDLGRANTQQGQADRHRAVSSGAFGGSRGRLMEQERERAFGRGAAEAVGGIRQAGYTGAQQAAQRAGQGLGVLGGQLGQFGQGIGQLGGQLGQFGQGIGQLGGQYGQLGGQLGQFGQGLTSTGGQYGQLGGQFGQFGQGLGALGGQYGQLGRGMGQMGTGFGQLGMTGQQGLMNQMGAFSKLGQQARGIQDQMYGAQYGAAQQMAQEPWKRMQAWQGHLGMLPQGSMTQYGSQPGSGLANYLKLFGMV